MKVFIKKYAELENALPIGFLTDPLTFRISIQRATNFIRQTTILHDSQMNQK